MATRDIIVIGASAGGVVGGLAPRGDAAARPVELVTAAVEGSALDHPASRAEAESHAAAAAQWANEAWRAA